jgi:hypothetical protein
MSARAETEIQTREHRMRDILVLQEAPSGLGGEQGGSPAGLAELREALGDSHRISPRLRQRLSELSRRVRAVQALGGEYARVGLSPMARSAREAATAAD